MMTKEIRPVPGIRLGVAAAGIKRSDRNDLLVIEMAPNGRAAATFTRNAFCAAPVTVARRHLAGRPRWILVNSGNANAGTGHRGELDALRCCASLAELVGDDIARVLPFSTGVIGEYLPVDKIEAALPEALASLHGAGWEEAARAIMTTDTCPKISSRMVTLDGVGVTLTGIAKGAGMIQPNMATMLAFIGTDAWIAADALQTILSDAVETTFNCITVDGDTSTNDACCVFASGQTGPEIRRNSPHYESFQQAVREVCAELSEAIVRDGEGATKLIRITVEQARDYSEAREVAKTVAHSPLVKTAFFASDPNWGRILAAIGRSPCPGLDIGCVEVWLDEVQIVAAGERAASYTEAMGQSVMNRPEIAVRIALNRGAAACTVTTCDLSYDYVRINAEYRT